MIAALFRHTLSLAVAASATVLIVAGSAASVSAGEIGTTPSIEVGIAGIDLTSAAGKARVESEIKRAARRVCDTGGRTHATAPTRAACIEAALAGALPRLETLASAQRDARAALADAASPTASVNR